MLLFVVKMFKNKIKNFLIKIDELNNKGGVF